MKRIWLRLLPMFTIAGGLLALLVGGSQSAAADTSVTGIELPPGFYLRTSIGGLVAPTDMSFMPDGDLLVTEKGGGVDEFGLANVRVVISETVVVTPVLTLSVNATGDSGLLSLALDPAFAANGYFYLYYAIGAGARDWAGETHNRLSRFTYDVATHTADPASELILIDKLPWTIQHPGGGLRFGADGTLYLAVGDVLARELAQDPRFPNGKILRMRPTATGYVVPPDNPYLDVADALPTVYAMGLRSPFRMTLHAQTGALYVGDVGAATWEEVNRIAPAANFGWPTREGPCPYGQRQPCAPAAPGFTDPAVSYPHPFSPDPDVETGSSVTGLAFYEGDGFPDEYHDALFMADLNLGTMTVAHFTDQGVTLEPFAANAPAIVDLEYADDQIYYLMLHSGTIGVISHADVVNRLPVARLTLDVTGGPAPLTVRFNTTGSSDPDGDALRYRWDFGDGTPPVVTADPVIAHTYTDDGNYSVRLRAEDARGGLAEPLTSLITVYSGTMPRIELINRTEPDRVLYHGGDLWEYRAVREADDADLDAETPYRWSLYLHHNQHAHPVLIGNETISDTLAFGTDNHGGDWNLWYRLELTMRTADGQDVTVERSLYPDHVRLPLDVVPAGQTLLVNDVVRAAPYTLKAIVGTEHTLEAPPTIVAREGIGEFDHWYVYTGGFPLHAADDGEIIPARRITLTVPATSVSYTAFYRFDRPAHTVYLPVIAGVPELD